ncbi:uncharacterized, partial [Tachysurus ichikawai]
MTTEQYCVPCTCKKESFWNFSPLNKAHEDKMLLVHIKGSGTLEDMASLFAIRMAINKGTLEGTLIVFFHVEEPIGALQHVFSTGRAHETAPHHVFSRVRACYR